jgi:peptidyl-prolyl cis-trans isomerase SurA
VCVPEFERAMDALQPGQVSEPIESPFGYHLIQVIERKTNDVSQERQRTQARQALRERKIEEETEEWLRQLRDRTYVEYRSEELGAAAGPAR